MPDKQTRKKEAKKIETAQPAEQPVQDSSNFVKKTVNEATEKTPAKEPEKKQNSMQTVLAVLLAISLLGNIYFLITPNNQGCQNNSPNQITGVTSTTITAGNVVVSAGMLVSLDYIGKYENGTVFDTSIQSEAIKAGSPVYNAQRTYAPFTFVPGSGQVIEGFDKGVIGMKVGEEKTITIPPSQGYTTGPLANKTLIFDVTVRNASIPQTVKMLIVNDKRCKTCDTTMLVAELKGIFPGLESTTIDYNTPEGQQLYTTLNLKVLPAVLFDPAVKDADGYSNIEQFVKPAGNYLMLAIGSKYDPTCYKADGTIDCSNPACSKDASCLAKADKPSVEVFVMSYCPYGTQIEKGLLPVLNLLGSKVDYSVKFVDYSMHGDQELLENMRQYCIQRDSKDKYLKYMQCFLSAGKSSECVKNATLDAAKLDKCINETDTKYKITATAKDNTKWNGASYPPFPIDAADNTKYGVQGSPSFVLNGVLISNQGRDPQSLLDAICGGYTTKPPECSQKLSTDAPSAGFGFAASTGTASSSGGCASA